MEKYKSKIIFSAIHLLIFVLVFCYFFYLKFDRVILGDDINFLLDSSMLSGFLNITYYINKFFIYQLPLALNIHPNSFIYFCNGIECLIIYGTLFAFSIYTSFFSKRDFLKLTFLFVSFVYYAYLCRDLYMFIDNSYVTGRYIFPLMLLVCVLFAFSSIFLQQGNEKPKYIKHYLIPCIFILLLTDNTEYFTLFLCIFFTLFSIFVIFQQKEKRIKYLLCVIPFILSTLVNCVLYFKFSRIGIIESYLDIQNVQTFFANYWNILILRGWLLLLVLLSAFSAIIYFLIKKKDENNFKVFVLSLLICLSNFLVMFSFILFDTEFYFNNNISLIWKMMFLVPIFMLISQIIENFDKHKQYFIEKIISVSLLFLICIFSLFVIKEMKYFIDMQIDKNKLNREEVYLNEKILLYSYLNNFEPKIFIPTYVFDEFKIICSEDVLELKCHKNSKIMYHFFLDKVYNLHNSEENSFCYVTKEQASEYLLYLESKINNKIGEGTDFQKLLDYSKSYMK